MVSQPDSAACSVEALDSQQVALAKVGYLDGFETMYTRCCDCSTVVVAIRYIVSKQHPALII